MVQWPIGLQLYSLRELTAKDFRGTLKMVAKTGFGAVEFAGYGNIPSREMKMLLADLGLKPVGSHIGIEALQAGLHRELDYCSELGCGFVIVPWAPDQYRTDATAWRRLADELCKYAEATKACGMRFAYHNHAVEFEKVDGRPGLEFLLDAGAGLLEAEVDTYWVEYAGADPAAVIRGFKGRCPLVHMKDMARTETRGDCEIGEGLLDWPQIKQACQDARVEAYVVEQEEFDKPHVESLQITIRNLRALGLA